MFKAFPPLEKKSISITRLKLTGGACAVSGVVAWKEKYLDYEIETISRTHWRMLETRPWKEKYLDYEIETWSGTLLVASNSSLKRKVSRLRDWNSSANQRWLHRIPLLKRKVSRLRDWNEIRRIRSESFKMNLKRKVSRLRDWNATLQPPKSLHHDAWKEKYLDYEIETGARPSAELWIWSLKRKVSRLRDWNKIKVAKFGGIRFFLKRKVSRLRDWNPRTRYQQGCECWRLEKKSISITRLKPRFSQPARYFRYTWKEKYLDYEIETLVKDAPIRNGYPSWKEKYLDYEIETQMLCFRNCRNPCLKRKVSRLRDWNVVNCDLLYHKNCLEKKSISITRLKPEWWPW